MSNARCLNLGMLYNENTLREWQRPRCSSELR